ncbi:MAG TPA: acyltransferase [Micavibrio sp.]|nr:acyltransferase [Micavibrio sp.]
MHAMETLPPPTVPLPHRPNLDGLRFIMCLGIAVFHLGPYFFGRGHDAILKFDYFTDVFFIMSAYLLARSAQTTPWTKASYFGFLKKRLIRLYPLYFASLLFFILVAVVAAAGMLTPNNPSRYDLSLLPFHLLLMQSWSFIDSLTFNYVAWAVSALWLMYLFFPVFSNAVKRYPGASIIAVPILLFVFDCSATVTAGLTITEIQRDHFGFLRAIPSFLFGVWLACANDIKMKPSVAISLFWATTALLFIYPAFLNGSMRLGFVYAAIFFFIIADNQNAGTPFAWKGFKYLAPYAYGIFLLHTIIATVFLAFLMPRVIDESVFTGPDGWVYATAGLALSLTASLIAGMAGYHLIEKPAGSFLKKYL